MSESGASAAGVVVGLFVGGRSSRMGGEPKGLLRAPDSEQTLLERLVSECRAALPRAELVLVGSATAYESLALPVVEDRPAGVGPLGGLLGLLTYAEQRGAQHTLALACDLPRLGRSLISRLAIEHPQQRVVLVRQSAVRNPLIARYAVQTALEAATSALADGRRSLQAVLDRLEPGVASLSLSPGEETTLVDWDVPEDVR